ncbi:TonB-dependent receptor [Mariniflexile litorale]|uniref:TonB-dependent receptor n=1 Tax=Mariniflexile litorale TaxID=3045158 RepID=A0AAU7EKU5_9FLAO|nr:TonB-dependent receptor [Mariniflexile sp. KMM 9835]MDQ8210615.1 TonB-dependent receptor [Mariniflexile sp. KMM 9835]
MKTFILLFCTIVFSLPSGDIFSQNSKIEIDKDKIVTIDEIFDLLRTQTNYTFIYQEDLFKNAPKVQIKKGSIKANKLLKETLSSGNFNFDFHDDNKIVITKVKQQTQISGIVTDGSELGGPLPGVTVIVKGTSNGTSTDFDGSYTLNNIVPNAVLVFSYVGYKTQEVTIGNQSSVNVTLEIDISQLDEIVIVDYGYGKIKKTDMTGASASIGSKELATIPVSSAAEALSGRLPGVNVTTADGEPGSTVRIRVRGGTSLSQDNSPLFVVDGFIVSGIDDIPVNDIATIDVLKDAAATAIYGAQASNGVIVVTTKSPVAGKISVSYNNYYQFNELPQDRKYEVLSPYEFVLANYEYEALQGEAAIKGFEKYFGKYDDIELYKNRKATDWQDELFGGSRVSEYHNLSIGGGTELTKVNLSLSHNNDEGLLTGSGYQRTAINFKLNQKISDRLSFDAQARITNSIKDGAGTSSSQLSIKDAVQTRPVNGIADELDIDLNQVTDNDDFQQFLLGLVNPNELVKQDWRRRTEHDYVLNAALTWAITDEITAKSSFSRSKGFQEDLRFYGPLTGESFNNGGSLPLGQRTNKEDHSYRWINTLNYKKDWGESRLDVLLGQEISSSGGEDHFIRAENFRLSVTPEELFANMQFGDVDRIDGGVFTDTNRKSVFGRFDFQLQDKYVFTLTARADQSSKFAKENSLGIFPALAFAWKIDQENFMQNVDFVDELKLRISYGETGNDRISSGLTQFLFKAETNKGPGFGNKDNLYYTPDSSTLYNPELIWETTVTSNYGLDFTMFKRRLNGSLDYYENETRDLLYTQAIPTNTGFNEQYANIGSTANKGIELGLTGYIIDTKDFSLSANFNIGRNVLTIEKLDGTQTKFAQSGWAGTDLRNRNDYQLELGGKIGNMYGFVTEGFYSVDDFESYDEVSGKYILKDGVADASGTVGGALRPGSLKLKDLATLVVDSEGVPVLDADGKKVYEQDGQINDDDRKIIGNALPDFQGGFGFNVRYKGFDLAAFFNYQVGNDVYNTGKIQFNQYRRISNGNLLSTMSLDNRFTYLDIDGSYTGTPGGIVTDLEQLRDLNQGKNIWSHASHGVAAAVIHDWAIEDGSFLRLNNLTLGYSLPEKLISKMGLSKFRVFATGRNLHIWTKYSGYDPEVNSNSNPFTPGLDESSFPRSRSYTLGVNLTF